ncbi:hypothetical protein EMIT0196MI5_170150 [Pseudomonas sp. IT-196MI5]
MSPFYGTREVFMDVKIPVLWI